MTNIYQPNVTTYQQAKKLLENDALVVFPTETIYGLGANALSDIAAQKIFTLKGRPNDNPLIVHLGSKEQISDYAEIENEIQQTIIDKLMPGPITLLLKKKNLISNLVCPVEYVGIRLPSNHIAQAFLQTVNLPIAAPSANISGKPSPTNAQMVYDNIGKQIPMIIDGGESEAGIESTVIRVIEARDAQPCRTSPTPPLEGGRYKILILRPGFVTKEDLEYCFDGQIEVAYSQLN
jgi:L-threonylcarbamoyladenylate synthase